MTPLFIATERFDASDGPKWTSYTEWARIPNLTEIIGLDSMLCPYVIKRVEGDDWNHNLHEDCRLDYFLHLDYLIRRVANVSRKNVLGLYRNPDVHVDVPPAAGNFVFVGYELIEVQGSISAITNCGGFPETFSNDELNEFGLISSFARALEIKTLLPVNNPQEHHAKCEMFAIWRLS